MKLGNAALAVFVAIGMTTMASAFDFDAPSFRSIARRWGVALGPGYHSVPCLPNHAKHYCRSVHGITHPTFYATPLGQAQLYKQHQARMNAAAPVFYAAPVQSMPIDAMPNGYVAYPQAGHQLPTPAIQPIPSPAGQGMDMMEAPGKNEEPSKTSGDGDRNNPLKNHPLWQDSEDLREMLDSEATKSLEEALPEDRAATPNLRRLPGSGN